MTRECARFLRLPVKSGLAQVEWDWKLFRYYFHTSSSPQEIASATATADFCSSVIMTIVNVKVIEFKLCIRG
ncbi:hypothetical protein RRG08_028331 [Elysia crispata]|uniref:Uncharacterized protein n=1 Tax=Elysia crispata TaxID=231223 RepID=A0AAE1AWK6_9GAST|nr:hypothetical protein RRG08_028331 [Elysia crispata]